MCISIHMHRATFSGEMCWQKHAPSTPSSSCCHHCVLVLHKDTDLLTMLNTFSGCGHWISCFLSFKGTNFCIILMFLFIICDLYPMCSRQIDIYWWNEAVLWRPCIVRKKKIIFFIYGITVSIYDTVGSLILCCTVS